MRPRIVAFLEGWSGTGLLVPDYALLLAVGIVLTVALTVERAERSGLDPGQAFRVCLVTIGAALVSSRLYVVAQHWDWYRASLADVLWSWDGGVASYGAYVGGALGAIAAARWQRLAPSRFLDACGPAVPLLIVLGRVGCFLGGCCHGQISDVPWAVRFPEGSDAYVLHLEHGLVGRGDALSLPVHPTQLYEAGWAVVLFSVLAWYDKRRRHDGTSFAWLFVLYPVGRFLIEFLRGDGAAPGLSPAQRFSLVAVCLAGGYLLTRSREPRAASLRAQTSP